MRIRWRSLGGAVADEVVAAAAAWKAASSCASAASRSTRMASISAADQESESKSKSNQSASTERGLLGAERTERLAAAECGRGGPWEDEYVTRWTVLLVREFAIELKGH